MMQNNSLPNPCRKLNWIIAAFILVWQACSLHEPSWDIDLLAPLAKTSVNLADALPRNYVSKDTAGLLKLVYSKAIFGLQKENFFRFYDTGITKSFTIDSLSLFEARISYPVTLGALARQAGAAGTIILLLNGQTFMIPPIGPITSGKIPLSADTLFQSMTLEKGQMDIALSNGFPIEITDVEFELRNEIDNALIVKGFFPRIGIDETVTQSFDLSGKTIQSKLVAQITSLSSPGSGNQSVLIDTADEIRADIRVYDLFPSEATAIWPAQNLINQKSNFTIRRIPVELTYAVVRTGRLRIHMVSTLQDSIYFTYELGSARKNGIPFVFQKTLPPAPANGTSSVTEIYSFDGYELDLRGKDENLYNSMANTTIASIQRTGIMKTLSKNDSLRINIQFESIDPYYVRGYMRDTTFHFGPDQSDLSIFKDITAQALQIEEATVSLRIENNMGVDTEFSVAAFEAENTKTNQKAALVGPVINAPLAIPRATDPSGSLPVKSQIANVEINEKNSNIAQLISLLPNRIYHALQFRMNPLGNVSGHRDFIYSDKVLDVQLNIEMPMFFSSEGLALCDTSSLSIDASDWNQVQSGHLLIAAKNKYPLDARLHLSLLDASGNEIDQITTGTERILAGAISAAGIVESPTESVLKIPIDRDLITNITQSKFLKTLIVLDTQPAHTGVKLFAHYNIELQVSANLVYRIE